MNKSEKTLLNVEGMNCQHCSASIETNLQKIDGVEEVFADHSKDIVQFTGNAAIDKIKETITQLGYTIKS